MAAAAGRLPRTNTASARLPRLVLPADDGLHLSCPKRQMLRFPVATMIRFCHNHGTAAGRRPAPVVHRARRRATLRRAHPSGVPIGGCVRPRDASSAAMAACRSPPTRAPSTRAGHDGVHSDQALRLLADPTPDEQRLPGPSDTRTTTRCCTPMTMLPRGPPPGPPGTTSTGAARSPTASQASVCLHYLNRLQPLPWPPPGGGVAQSGPGAVDAAHIVGEYHYAHPVFDLAAIDAQHELPRLQGYPRHLLLRRLDRLRLPRGRLAIGPGGRGLLESVMDRSRGWLHEPAAVRTAAGAGTSPSQPGRGALIGFGIRYATGDRSRPATPSATPPTTCCCHAPAGRRRRPGACDPQPAWLAELLGPRPW